MDIKNTAIGAKVVIESLICLLENEGVDISSIKFKVGSDSEGYESPKIEFQKLINVTLNELDELKTQVPEGFVLVPKELSENIAHQLAKSKFKKSETIFNSSYRDLSIDAKNDLKQKWIEQKTRCIVVDYKTLIGKAQEQSHENG